MDLSELQNTINGIIAQIQQVQSTLVTTQTTVQSALQRAAGDLLQIQSGQNVISCCNDLQNVLNQCTQIQTQVGAFNTILSGLVTTHQAILAQIAAAGTGTGS